MKDLIGEKGNSIDILTGLEAEYEKQNDLAATSTRSMTAEQKAASLKSIELSTQITKLKGKIGNIDEQIKTTTGTQQNLNDEWDYASDYITTYSTTAQKRNAKCCDRSNICLF